MFCAPKRKVLGKGQIAFLTRATKAKKNKFWKHRRVPLRRLSTLQDKVFPDQNCDTPFAIPKRFKKRKF